MTSWLLERGDFVRGRLATPPESLPANSSVGPAYSDPA